jgi:ABC-2 type transport system permease protein
LAGGLLGIAVVYGQRAEVGGWDRAGALAVLGVYLLAQALHSLFIGPGLDSLSGLSGDLWTGRLDFTLLRPLNTQVMVSVRRWRPWALVDLVLALGVLGYAVALAGARPGAGEWLAFAAALGCGLIILYALLLACTAVIFWSPGLLLTWVFHGIIQMARYPLGLYPGWLRLALTW